MTDQTDQTVQTDQTDQDYGQVSSHLKAAGEEVTQLLDLLTEGLAVEAQVRRDAAHRSSTPDSTREASPDSASSNSTGETSGPGAGETR